MGFFSKILATLGIGDAEASEAPAPAAPASTPAAAASVTPPAPKAIAAVDVVAQLEKRAAANSQKLNWKTSIVDLLKLLEIDSSYGARKELAKELNCPEANMGGAASGGGASSAGGLASMLDMNGDGNPLDDILRMAGKALR